MAHVIKFLKSSIALKLKSVALFAITDRKDDYPAIKQVVNRLHHLLRKRSIKNTMHRSIKNTMQIIHNILLLFCISRNRVITSIYSPPLPSGHQPRRATTSVGRPPPIVGNG